MLPAGAFGAVRPVGAILPTATAAGPFSRSRRRLRRSEGPCRPVMFRYFSVTGHAYMALTMLWGHIAWQRWSSGGWLRHMDMPRIYLCGHVAWTALKLFTSSGQGPLIFDPLGNGSPVLHIDNQKVNQSDECQEAGSKGGSWQECPIPY